MADLPDERRDPRAAAPGIRQHDLFIDPKNGLVKEAHGLPVEMRGA